MLLARDPRAPSDFDFILGQWKVKHRRLKEILAGSEEWVGFEGDSATVATLGGFGNIEDNRLYMPDETVSAKAIRSYDAATGLWSIWWLDGRHPRKMDTPVTGKFINGVGRFYAEDIYQGQDIQVRFIWDATQADQPTWEQAFSSDGGHSWETNWTMQFSRV